ncbi:MAG: ParB/RepB/Spo0J family partition protein [Gammaproteobacteria bacterium]|nr:ParB/RepB/Spo0J family partition protein [Gammaproteobacteria bacterium]MDH5659681.1 ParB/RepB/Spo0J family partition protein [Gammaproteobacteria bacterium]
MVKKRGLGKGLEALLGSGATNLKDDIAQVTAKQIDSTTSSAEFQHLPIDVIQRGRYQPRTNFNIDALQELADSIKAQGVVQPIVVRPLSATPGQYELVAGERRWRAAQLAELHEIPALVRDISDQEAMAVALIENIQRQELNPIEEAKALVRLVEEFGLTHQEAADAVGRSRVSVSNLLRLLTLATDVRHMVEDGQLEMGHARAILGLESTKQLQAAQEVAKKGLSVRETEQLVRKLNKPESEKVEKASLDPDTRRLQEDLSEKLGAKVVFQHGNNGKGKMLIHYNSIDELDGILDHIK